MKKLLSKIYIAMLLTLLIAISALRVFDIATGFKIRKAYLDPIIDPLFDNYPVVMTILSVLILIYWVVSKAIKADIELNNSTDDVS